MEKQKEKKIEYIVTTLTLLFFLLIGAYLIRGCDTVDNSLDVGVTAKNTSVEKVHQEKVKVKIVPDTKEETHQAEQQISKLENDTKAKAEALRLENEAKAKVEALRVENEARARAEALRLENEAKAQAEALRLENEAKAQAEALRVENEAKARAEALRLENEAKAQTEALRVENKAKAQAEALKVENEAKAKEKGLDLVGMKEEQGILADIQNHKVSDKTYILKGIYFKTSSSSLTDASTRQLDVIAQKLKTSKEVKVMLQGHTDNTGSEAINKRLSTNRAVSVKNALIKRGIESNRIIAKGKAGQTPIASNNTKEGKRLNRRVDIAVIQ